jgi:hypothetical protein
MVRLAVGWKRLGWVVVAAWLMAGPWRSVPAQAPRANNANANANTNANAKSVADLTRKPLDLPPTPPQGAWGEVIMANAKWLVVQNHEGQQFPISADAIEQFLVRWPTTFDALTPETLVEAIGRDGGSNVVRTDHVDVFEGTDRTLVTPTYVGLMPTNPATTIDPRYNRFMNGLELGPQALMYGWSYPVSQYDLFVPDRLHVVGSAIGINPLQLRIPGNNVATVLPFDPGGITITQITRGTTSLAEKGDLVYLMPTSLTPRTVTLSQVVLYKKISVRQFRLP